MTLDEAIKVLRQHNIKGTSVLRITKGQALEKDLLAQVLDSCEQLISEKAEYKRLLKAAVEDLNATIAKVYNGDVICERCKWKSQIGECCCPDAGGCDTDYRWQYAAEALALIGEDTNDYASADVTNVGGKIDSWISVDDRLPESEKEVLVWYKYTWDAGFTSYGFGINVWYSNAKQWRDGCLLKGVEVLYWQPLPKPPKDGEQNERNI